MLPTLPTDSEFLRMEVFPYNEGHQFEFKRSTSEACLGSGLDKLKSTLCAFLNGEGGHFICGIDDVSRQLRWIPLDSKSLDRTLLQIDEIFHRMSIRTIDNAPIEPKNIVTRIVSRPTPSPSPGTDLEYILILTALPTPGTRYKCRGHMWYRLNASNFSATEEICYGAAEVRYMMSQHRKKIYNEIAPLIDARGKHILSLERKLRETEHLALVCAQIIADKAKAERTREVECESIGWVASCMKLLCGCLI